MVKRMEKAVRKGLAGQGHKKNFKWVSTAAPATMGSLAPGKVFPVIPVQGRPALSGPKSIPGFPHD